MLDQDERRALGFLLDFEYLVAELYGRAKTGRGLSHDQRGVDAGDVHGGHIVRFTHDIVAAFVEEAARDAASHVVALRHLLSAEGKTPHPASAIDLDRSFTAMARGAALIRQDQRFDAFASDTNLLLAAYMLEEVGMTACAHALRTATPATGLGLLAGLYASVTSRAAIVRLFLFTARLSDQTNAISVFRQKACGLAATPFQGSDHGIGTLQSPSIMPLTTRGLGWERTLAQCAAILSGRDDDHPDRFFPLGINALEEAVTPPLTRRHLSELIALGSTIGIESLESVPPERVTMDALELDLENHDLIEDTPIQPWTQNAYTSCEPKVCVIENALVHTNVGIVGIGDMVVGETLWHSDPKVHRYRMQDEIAHLDADAAEPLDEMTVSILTGSAESYWHTIIDSVARLVLIPDALWSDIRCVLFPSTGIQMQTLLGLWHLPPHVERREVKPHESFKVSKLVYPGSLHVLFNYHPALLRSAFARLASQIVPRPGSPRFIYIDRRRSPLRVLLNEDELVASLPDFTIVRLETLTVVEQISLFVGADIVVAPHGAGLTNIGFSRPQTVVVEMMMDAYCNWCYRRMAAIASLRYVCVLGRCVSPPEVKGHRRTWTVDRGDLLQAIDKARTLASG